MPEPINQPPESRAARVTPPPPDRRTLCAGELRPGLGASRNRSDMSLDVHLFRIVEVTPDDIDPVAWLDIRYVDRDGGLVNTFTVNPNSDGWIQF